MNNEYKEMLENCEENHWDIDFEAENGCINCKKTVYDIKMECQTANEAIPGYISMRQALAWGIGGIF